MGHLHCHAHHIAPLLLERGPVPLLLLPRLRIVVVRVDTFVEAAPQLDVDRPGEEVTHVVYASSFELRDPCAQRLKS